MAIAATKPNIVVIGGSFGGYYAVVAIAEAMHKTHNTILIEKNSHNQYLFAFPRFSVVSGYERLAFIPFTDNFDKNHSVSVVRAKATAILPDKVVLDRVHEGGSNEMPYEYLVITTGTTLPPPGSLKTETKIEGVAYFQKHQRQVFEAQKIAVIGAGAVGVQIAADIKESYPEKNVTVIHSRNNLMSRFHPKLHEIVMKRYAELGINVILGDRCKIPEAGFPVDGSTFKIHLNSGRTVEADFAIAAFGMTPNSSPLKTLSPSSVTENGFISVKRTLQLTNEQYPKVFAMGDIADIGPKNARVIITQSELVARNIQRISAGDAKQLEKYTYTGETIYLSLGLTHKVGFEDPHTGNPEPYFYENETGTRDVLAADRWKMLAPNNTDYDS